MLRTGLFIGGGIFLSRIIKKGVISTGWGVVAGKDNQHIDENDFIFPVDISLLLEMSGNCRLLADLRSSCVWHCYILNWWVPVIHF